MIPADFIAKNASPLPVRSERVVQSPGDRIPDTSHPIQITDDEVSSGETGAIAGAVDFFASATFNAAASEERSVGQRLVHGWCRRD
jgi:hypothetical protein